MRKVSEDFGNVPVNIVYYDMYGCFERAPEIIDELSRSESLGDGRISHVFGMHKEYERYLCVYVQIEDLKVKVGKEITDDASVHDIMTQADCYASIGKMKI